MAQRHCDFGRCILNDGSRSCGFKQCVLGSPYEALKYVFIYLYIIFICNFFLSCHVLTALNSDFIHFVTATAMCHSWHCYHGITALLVASNSWRIISILKFVFICWCFTRVSTHQHLVDLLNVTTYYISISSHLSNASEVYSPSCLAHNIERPLKGRCHYAILDALCCCNSNSTPSLMLILSLLNSYYASWRR